VLFWLLGLDTLAQYVMVSSGALVSPFGLLEIDTSFTLNSVLLLLIR
jgi:hypothetical protein